MALLIFDGDVDWTASEDDWTVVDWKDMSDAALEALAQDVDSKGYDVIVVEDGSDSRIYRLQKRG